MVTPLLIENSSRVLCLGDFNIHVDQENDLRAKAFNSLLSEIGLLQHVCFPTHEKVHTLDLVLTDVRHPTLIREPGPTLQGYVQSDHNPLCFDITCPKPHKPSKIIQFRKWFNLDLEHLKSKLSSNLTDSTATSDVNTMIYCQFVPKPYLNISTVHVLMMKYELQISSAANLKGSGVNHDQITIVPCMSIKVILSPHYWRERKLNTIRLK